MKSKRRSEASYDGANIRPGVEYGDMGGFDGGSGYRVWTETIQVDKESDLEKKSFRS